MDAAMYCESSKANDGKQTVALVARPLVALSLTGAAGDSDLIILLVYLILPVVLLIAFYFCFRGRFKGEPRESTFAHWASTFLGMGVAFWLAQIHSGKISSGELSALSIGCFSVAIVFRWLDRRTPKMPAA